MASEDSEIILYDVPTKEPRICSSPNTWKVRALLNFKGIPYKTIWLEYPEIEPTLSKLDLEPNKFDMSTGTYAKYWLPVVRLLDGRYIMESQQIAHVLEELYPEPFLGVDSPLTQRALEISNGVQHTLVPAFLYRLPDDHLSEASREWYHAQRSKLFSSMLGTEMDLYQVTKLEPFKGEAPWRNSEATFEKLSAMLRESDEGPFVAGTNPTYADFVIVGLFKSLRLFDREGDVHGRVMARDPAFQRLEEGCSEWFERDSY